MKKHSNFAGLEKVKLLGFIGSVFIVLLTIIAKPISAQSDSFQIVTNLESVIVQNRVTRYSLTIASQSDNTPLDNNLYECEISVDDQNSRIVEPLYANSCNNVDLRIDISAPSIDEPVADITITASITNRKTGSSVYVPEAHLPILLRPVRLHTLIIDESNHAAQPVDGYLSGTDFVKEQVTKTLEGLVTQRPRINGFFLTTLGSKSVIATTCPEDRKNVIPLRMSDLRLPNNWDDFDNVISDELLHFTPGGMAPLDIALLEIINAFLPVYEQQTESAIQITIIAVGEDRCLPTFLDTTLKQRIDEYCREHLLDQLCPKWEIDPGQLQNEFKNIIIVIRAPSNIQESLKQFSGDYVSQGFYAFTFDAANPNTADLFSRDLTSLFVDPVSSLSAQAIQENKLTLNLLTGALGNQSDMLDLLQPQIDIYYPFPFNNPGLDLNPISPDSSGTGP